jgi:hypothetical protein
VFSVSLEALIDEILQLALPSTSDFEHVSMNWLHRHEISE